MIMFYTHKERKCGNNPKCINSLTMHSKLHRSCCTWPCWA